MEGDKDEKKQPQKRRLPQPQSVKKVKIINWEDTLTETKAIIQEKKREVDSTIKKAKTRRKPTNNSDEKDNVVEELTGILERTADEYAELEKRVDMMEISFRKQLKRMFLNPYYQRISKDPEKQAGQGSIFNYSKESIHPHSDSLFQ